MFSRNGKAVAIVLATLFVALVGLSPVFGEETPIQARMRQSRKAFTPIEVYKPGFMFPTERVRLTFWDYMSERLGRLELLKKISNEYKRIHPNVQVNVKMIPWKGYEAKYKTAFEAKTAPDIITWNPSLSVPFKLVVSSPRWVRECAEKEFVEQAVYMGTWNGEYWGILVNAQIGQFMYYNKDMFKAKGLDVNDPPETVPELLAYAKKLTERDSRGEVTLAGFALRHGGHRGGMAGKWNPLLWPFIDSSKGTHYNDDYSDVIFDSREHIDALQFYGDLMHKHKIASTKLPMPGEAFQFKRAAMIYRESPWISRFKNYAPDLDFGVAPLANGASPYGKYPVPPTLGRLAHTVMVTNQCPPKYHDVAYDFLMFMNTGDRDLRLSRLETSRAQWIPNSATRSRETLFGKVAEVLFARPRARAEIEPHGFGGEISSYVGEAIERVFVGEANAADALKEAARKGRALLAKAR